MPDMYVYFIQGEGGDFWMGLHTADGKNHPYKDSFPDYNAVTDQALQLGRDFGLPVYDADGDLISPRDYSDGYWPISE